MFVASEMRLGFRDVFWLRAYVFVESVFVRGCGRRGGGGEAEGRKETWKESKKVVMGFYTRRESDDCSFILLA